MGILHELLIVVGLMLLLVIGWSVSIVVRENSVQRAANARLVNERHTCQGGVCALRP
jgi:hypothetical protein